MQALFFRQQTAKAMHFWVLFCVATNLLENTPYYPQVEKTTEFTVSMLGYQGSVGCAMFSSPRQNAGFLGTRNIQFSTFFGCEVRNVVLKCSYKTLQNSTTNLTGPLPLQ